MNLPEPASPHLDCTVCASGVTSPHGATATAGQAAEAEARRRAGIKDYTCGACFEEFGSNLAPGDIQCTNCDARLCPCCGSWFGELGEIAIAAQEPHAAPGLSVATFGYNGCLTPDAVYATHIGTAGLSVNVDYGRELDIDEDGAEKLDAGLHAALERLLAQYFGGAPLPLPGFPGDTVSYTEVQPAPELAAAMADWRKTAHSLKGRSGTGDARERNTLEVVIGQVEAILTGTSQPAPSREPAEDLTMMHLTPPDTAPKAAPELAEVMNTAAQAALARVLSWFAADGTRRGASATRAQLAHAYADGGLTVPEELRRFL